MRHSAGGHDRRLILCSQPQYVGNLFWSLGADHHGRNAAALAAELGNVDMMGTDDAFQVIPLDGRGADAHA
jgi:hypothetical protein